MHEKNVSFDIKEGATEIKINSKVYPLDVIYQAADVFVDKAYAYLDGDPEKEIIVTLKPKGQDTGLESLAGDFKNELVNYAAYFVRAQVNHNIRIGYFFSRRLKVIINNAVPCLCASIAVCAGCNLKHSYGHYVCFAPQFFSFCKCLFYKKKVFPSLGEPTRSMIYVI